MMELFNTISFPKIVKISHYYLILIDIIFLLKTYDIVCMIEPMYMVLFQHINVFFSSMKSEINQY